VAEPTLTFSRLTGLYEQKVTVTNVAARAIAGFDLALAGLREGVILYNGVSGTAGTASLAYHQPLEAGQVVTLVLEYWANPRGDVPAPTITPSVTPPASGDNAVAGDAAAPKLEINRCLKMEDCSFVIEFTAQAGRSYRIQYSDNGGPWKSCPMPILAGGTKVQWIDRGPPWTESHPSTKTSRYYRVTEE